jgi:hypothetical protein
VLAKLPPVYNALIMWISSGSKAYSSEWVSLVGVRPVSDRSLPLILMAWRAKSGGLRCSLGNVGSHSRVLVVYRTAPTVAISSGMARLMGTLSSISIFVIPSTIVKAVNIALIIAFAKSNLIGTLSISLLMISFGFLSS